MNNDWWDYLEHSSKGSTWKKHKYISKKNGKYVYDRDGAKDSNESEGPSQLTLDVRVKRQERNEARERYKELANIIRKGNPQQILDLLKDEEYLKDLQEALSKYDESKKEYHKVRKKKERRNSNNFFQRMISYI